MPIPLPLENLSTGRELMLVPQALPVENRRALVYPRMLAHVVDFCVVQGSSLYCAKLASVFLIAFHAHAISRSGKIAAPLLREAYDYSSMQLFAAAFSALGLLYFVGLPLLLGRTFGLGLLGLQIRSNDGAPLTVRALSLRMLGAAINYATCGALCVLGLRERGGPVFLQDLLSGTSITKD